MRLIMLITLIGSLLAGCQSLRFPGVYRIDIPQGNFVTEEMVDNLKPTMTPEQVRFVLGPPTLVDPFTADTWFYLMRLQPGKGEVVEQQLVVHFDNGTYSHYDGEVIEDFRNKVIAPQDRQLASKADQERRATEPDAP